MAAKAGKVGEREEGIEGAEAEKAAEGGAAKRGESMPRCTAADGSSCEVTKGGGWTGYREGGKERVGRLAQQVARAVRRAGREGCAGEEMSDLEALQAAVKAALQGVPSDG